MSKIETHKIKQHFPSLEWSNFSELLQIVASFLLSRQSMGNVEGMSFCLQEFRERQRILKKKKKP